VRYKKLRDDVFNLDFKDPTLKLKTPYFRISVLPEKTTFSGKHPKRLCFSIGTRYTPEKAEKFFKSDDPLKAEIIKRMAKETGLTVDDIIKRQKNGKLHNFLIDTWAFTAKKLGLPIIIFKKKRAFEMYEMCKTSDIDEVFSMIMGCLIGLGRAIREFGTKEDLDIYKLKIKKIVEKLVDKGFYG